MIAEPPPRHRRGRAQKRPTPVERDSRTLAAHHILANAPEWVVIAESDQIPGPGWQSPTAIWAWRQGFEVARRWEPTLFGDKIYRVYARHPFAVPAFNPILE